MDGMKVWVNLASPLPHFPLSWSFFRSVMCSKSVKFVTTVHFKWCVACEWYKHFVIYGVVRHSIAPKYSSC